MTPEEYKAAIRDAAATLYSARYNPSNATGDVEQCEYDLWVLVHSATAELGPDQTFAVSTDPFLVAVLDWFDAVNQSKIVRARLRLDDATVTMSPLIARVPGDPRPRWQRERTPR